MTTTGSQASAVAYLLAALAGAAIPTQANLLADLAAHTRSSLAPVCLSFLTATLLTTPAVLLNPRWRHTARQLVAGGPRLSYLAGLAGATFLVVAVCAIPEVGIQRVAIASTAGLLVGGLIADHCGLPGRRRPATARRVVGAAMALAAVGLAAGPVHQQPPAGLRWTAAVTTAGGIAAIGTALNGRWTAAVTTAGGIAAIGTALNGRLRTTANAPIAAAVNFLTGTGVCLTALGAVSLIGRPPVTAWPRNPVLYLAGGLGVAVVAFTAVSTPAIGALPTTVALITGQIAASTVHAGRLALPVGIAGAVVVASATLIAKTGRPPARHRQGTRPPGRRRRR